MTSSKKKCSIFNALKAFFYMTSYNFSIDKDRAIANSCWRRKVKAPVFQGLSAFCNYSSSFLITVHSIL